mgnify:CR=1 FL=1
MKAVILAGGRGTRLSEETSLRPKPMVEIGGIAAAEALATAARDNDDEVAALLLPAGAIGDRFGRKGFLQAGLVLFAVDDLLDDINTDAMTPAWVCFDHDHVAAEFEYRHAQPQLAANQTLTGPVVNLNPIFVYVTLPAAIGQPSCL